VAHENLSVVVERCVNICKCDADLRQLTASANGGTRWSIVRRTGGRGAGGADAGGRRRGLSRAVLGAAEHCQGFPRCDRRTGARRASVAGSQAAGACRRPLVTWDCVTARSVSGLTTLLFYGSLITQVTARIFFAG